MKLQYLILVFPFLLSAQVDDKDDFFDFNDSDSVVYADDYELDYGVQLDDAELYHLKLNTQLEKKYYNWLKIRVRDVWPYVLSVQKEYYNISDSADLIENKRERKKFIKRRKKELSDKFENKLKDLSTSRGQVLCKLIHRETDRTVHEMIKEMRGGFNAFLWNTAGGAFKIDTKVEFNPTRTREDLFIEVILRKEFAAGRLQPYEDADWALVERQLNRTKAKKSTSSTKKKNLRKASNKKQKVVKKNG